MPGLTTGDGERLVNGASEELNSHNSRSPSGSDDVPVLVVGGGPAGLLMSYMLSKFGSKDTISLSKKLF